MKPASESSGVGEHTRLRLHPLSMRPGETIDEAADGSADVGVEWIVGRMETGQFVAIPPVGRRVIELLDTGLSVAAAGARVRAENDHEQELDIAEFVECLLELGFVAELDGHPVTEPAPPRPTWPWLHPKHVRWMLHPLTALTAAAIVLTAAVVASSRPQLWPARADLLWNNNRGALAILGNATVGWIIVALHELGHLCTARAAGAPARITLGTRLQFLVAQTDVSGVRAAPRRIRLTVYLAGMVINLLIASAATLARTLVPAHGIIDQTAAAACTISLLGLCAEFLLFMRTDIYFVMQDLAGAVNLYAESTNYLRYLTHHFTHGLGRYLGRPNTAPQSVDPSRSLTPRQRRHVLTYAPVLLLGTVACLVLAAFVTIPAAFAILSRAISTILTALTTPSSSPTAPRPAQLADAATALLLTATMQTLWTQAWCRRHAHRARAALHRLLHPRCDDGPHT